jgi:hypothetical protein
VDLNYRMEPDSAANAVSQSWRKALRPQQHLRHQ